MKASEYKKLTAKKQSISDVTLPSGATFKMRVAPIQQWVATGVLPASLAAKMQAAAGAKDKEAVAEHVLKTFTEEDFRAQQNLGRRMLEYSCVEPKVSVDGSDPDALAPEDITPEDFEALMRWVWSGGEAGESLDTFRPERQ